MTPLERTFERFSGPDKRTFGLILLNLTIHTTPIAINTAFSTASAGDREDA
jgi:hypothetical protein